jgi:hypothetical protein
VKLRWPFTWQVRLSTSFQLPRTAPEYRCQARKVFADYPVRVHRIAGYEDGNDAKRFFAGCLRLKRRAATWPISTSTIRCDGMRENRPTPETKVYTLGVSETKILVYRSFRRKLVYACATFFSF